MSFGGMMGGADLQILMTLKDEASKAMGGVGKNAGAMSQNIKRGAAIAGVAIVGIGIAATKMASDFDTGMREVATLLPGVEGVVEDLGDDVLELSKRFGIDAVEATGALYQAISAGVPQDNVMTFMEIASKAAIGGVTDLETAVDGITSVVNSFGEETVSAQQASDIMFTAVRLGKTNFEELSASLFQIIPTAASLGMSFEDVAASLAVMTAQGVPTRVATTQLRQLMVEATKSGTDLDTALRELGFGGMQEVLESGGNVSSLLSELRESMPDQEFRDLFGSVEAVNAAMLITGDNSAAVKDALGQMKDSAGATGEAFDTMAEGSAFAFNKAKASMKAAMIELGTAILPIVTKLAEGFSFLIGVLTDLPGPFKAAIVIFGGLIAVVGLLLPIIGVLGTIFGALAGVVPILAGAFVLLLGPIGLVVAAIAALVAIGILIVKNWDAIKRGGERVWSSIKRAVGDVGRAFENLGTRVQQMFDGAIQKVKDFFGFISQIPSRIRAAVANMPVIGGITQGVVGAVSAAGNLIGNFPRFAAGGIVPGPLGSPQMIVAHGGEEVVRADQRGGVTINIAGSLIHESDLVDLFVNLREQADRQGR